MEKKINILHINSDYILVNEKKEVSMNERFYLCLKNIVIIFLTIFTAEYVMDFKKLLEK